MSGCERLISGNLFAVHPGSRRHRFRPLIVLSLSLALVACPAALADVFLSNLDESNTASAVVGKSEADPTEKYTQAIRFRTGSNERGYNLTSVKAVLRDASESDGVRVRIFNSRSNGTPFYSLYTLSNPTIAEGINTFNLPTSATLEQDTWYFVVFDSTATGAGNHYEIRTTESDSLNSVADGWVLDTQRQSNINGSLFWNTDDNVPLVEINGIDVVQATDANLRSLSIDDGVKRFTTLLSRSFSPSTTSYTSAASSLVDQITIESTANNVDGASVAFLDGSDQLLSDADTEKEGFQVALAVGDNTIKVKVTAEDGSTTRIYTLTITREEPLSSPTALLSNLDEPVSQARFVGTRDRFTLAQGFETGDHEAGYTLNSVKIIVSQIATSAGMRIRIFDSTAEGTPNESIHSLGRAPNQTGVRTFEAPSNAMLEAGTKYFVVIDSDASRPSKSYKIQVASSDILNSLAPGWSMDTDRLVRTVDRDWYTDHRVPLLEVNGDAIVLSSDATLSEFDLTWDDDGTETDIALSPPFDAATKDYTASVAHGVDQVTVKATKGDEGAGLDYFDGADTRLTDADSNADGFQVGLAVGTNTIKAKVAASDGNSEETYSLVVTRAADVTAPATRSATVNGDTLVIAFGEALAAAANLANGAFSVKKTPSGGSEESVSLSGSPSISGATVTLTLATAVVSTDADVKVGYTKPTTGTDNTLRDANGNEVADFADLSVSNETPAERTLTAWFENAPATHDGAGRFTLDLVFSEAVFDGNESFNKNQAIQDALRVTGGTIKGRRRAARNAYDRWILWIEPSGDGDVTVVLPADGTACHAGGICTPDGVRLGAEARATVEGPPAEAPDAPAAPALTVGTTWIEASWTAPNDNGAAITGYDVEYRETGGNWQDADHTGTGATKRITGLAADTAYEVRVRASNPEGDSDWSPVASGRTEAEATPPDAPSAPALTAGTTWIEATWTAPDDNGAAITGYDLHYRETGGNWQDAGHSGTGTTKRIAGLAADTAHQVRVRASNANGAGDWSPAASKSTEAEQQPEGAAEGDVRLVGGSTDLEGRVEIYHNNEWGTVCDDRFVSDDAEVVCRQLGLTGGEARTRAAFGAGSGTIWMDDVQCDGGESRLADCQFGGWGLHNCRHSEDVGVSCGPAAGTSTNSVILSGTLLELRFDRALDAGSVPSPGDFVIEADGSAIPVASVAVAGDAALLELSRPAGPSENLTLSYLPASMHPLRDTSLNPVRALSGQPVRHGRVVATPSHGPALNAVAPRGIGSWDPQAKVEVLDLSSSGRVGLHDLSVFTDLERLDLSRNGVSDLSPLLAMAGLEELDLSDNAVSGLSPLGGLTSLRVLDLSDNQISNISPLASLTHLLRLDLSGNLVADLSPLSELPRLEVLLLDGNRVSSLTPLWNLPRLAHLSLRGNRAADAAMLREARSLRRLDLSGNRLRDVWVLGELPNLVFLGLSDNPVSDLSPLGRLTHLRWLAIDQRTQAADTTAAARN